MPQPPRIIEHLSKHWSSRGGATILAIVAHGTGGANSLAYLTQNPRSVSIPYLIARDGTIYHMVPDARAAHHAGADTSTLILRGQTYKGGRVNQVTTGFELESMQKGKPDDYTEAQLLSMGWLINDIRAHHGLLPIVRHGTLDPTRRSDPVGLSVSDMEEWAVKAALHFSPDWEALWGPIASPDQTTWNWDLPRLWQQHYQRLGKCIGGMLGGDDLIVQCFEGGDIRGRIKGDTTTYEVCFR
jgi:hypothetical protein